MSGSSDSEEFFDAEDDSFHRASRKSKQHECTSVELQADKASEVCKQVDDNVFAKPAIPKATIDLKSHVSVDCEQNKDKLVENGAESTTDKIVGRKRFRELRQRMQTEDDDILINNSPPDSQTSSIESVYPTPSKTTHPFRIIEHDTLSLQSMTSLGRVGRILAGVADNTSGVLIPGISQCPPATLTREGQMSSIASIPSKDEDTTSGKVSESSSVHTLSGDVLQESSINGRSNYASHSQSDKAVILQEPDVIASTKNNGKLAEDVAISGVPVAPPRRKKKTKAHTPTDLAPSAEKLVPASQLPSPASTIESITREFEHSLDIRSATKGQYVVKPQDEDKLKAEGPSSEELKRVERMKAELLSRSSEKSSSPLGSASSNSIGRYSLGLHKLSSMSPQSFRERRKSAGDQDMIKQLNMFVRTRTDSGKRLTDMEILEQVPVTNLDTGEQVPLSIAEDKLPQCINPLSLHIMRLTKSKYISNSSLEKEKESDEESVDSKMSSIPPDEDVSVDRVRKRTQKLKRFLGSPLRHACEGAKRSRRTISVLIADGFFLTSHVFHAYRDVDQAALARFTSASDRPAVVQCRSTLRRRDRSRRSRSRAPGLERSCAGAGLRAHPDREDSERLQRLRGGGRRRRGRGGRGRRGRRVGHPRGRGRGAR